MLGSDLPDGRETDVEGIEPTQSVEDQRSLADDVEALIDDGKTYVEAEIAYQKTRLSYAANRGKSGAGLVLAALAFLHLALIGLVVGGIMILAPLVGAAGATGIVVGILLVGVIVFGLTAKARFTKLGQAFEDDAQ